MGKNKLLEAFAADKRLLMVGSICTLLLVALLASQGINGLKPSSIALNGLMYLVMLMFFIVWRNIRLIVIERPDQLFLTIWQREMTQDGKERVVRAIPTVVLLFTFMPVFSAMKSAIPLICPLLSGPISILGMATKEEWNGKEAQAGRYHWQVA